MRTTNGGTKAKGGLYWNIGKWEIVTVNGREGELPGTPADRYLRIPTLSLLLLGPIMGFAFVLFLPLIGFALFGWQLARKAGQLATRVTRGASMAPATVAGPRGARLESEEKEKDGQVTSE